MARSIRCRQCRQKFVPDPRVGIRQHTCSNPECQRERHRKDCQAWRQRTGPDRQEARLRKRLVRRAGKRETPAEAASAAPSPGPSALAPPGGKETSPSREHSEGSELNWEAIRDELGIEVMVLLREFQRILVSRIELKDRQLRDELARQRLNIAGKTGRDTGRGARDEIGR